MADEPDCLLAIESSCDETAAAVIDRDRRVLSNVIASQHELHERFGGVVPEIASRAHLRNVLPVIDTAIADAGVTPDRFAAVAVTDGPGLVGSLLVGMTAAKTLAAVWDVPLVTVDHIRAHIYACRLAAGRDVFPAVGFVVSGGHTHLYDCRDAGTFAPLGATIDDAAGEAFDKAARVLGLPFPGGPAVSRAAEQGDPTAFKFPRPMLGDGLSFSFSGLKTAVLYAAKGVPGGPAVPELTEARIADLAASFEAAVVDVLVAKAFAAVARTGHRRLLVGGGVVANRRLRRELEARGRLEGVDVILSPPEYCTDNAAMAGLAWEDVEAGRFSPLDADVRSGLVRG